MAHREGSSVKSKSFGVRSEPVSSENSLGAVRLCSATKEATTSLNEPMRPTLDEALEYVVDDELVEVNQLV